MRAPRRSTSLFLIAAVLGALSLPLVVVSALWATFFSVGTRGGSTSEMIAYNLSHADTALMAYAPLGFSTFVLVAAFVLAIVGLVRRHRAR